MLLQQKLIQSLLPPLRSLVTTIPILSVHEVIKILEAVGFQIVSQKESHIKMKKKTPEKTFITMSKL
ncbi:type II toxin-antitoxin system HicA family toxin [Methanolobus psychrotolerans]|uniref:type II toxin-antitoxin system HicA family toxin n=1 Tax=Methanolobus psychrotolerans TaxID=1874706 RepID=UPI001F5C2445|nr:type II toxin-antitoxin system HicA family toxin [Methanolobus psychrotolerans]